MRIDQIALLVFDEAHHCVRHHAANGIMQNFYHPAKEKETVNIPKILGLTASPIMRQDPNGLEYVFKFVSIGSCKMLSSIQNDRAES